MIAGDVAHNHDDYHAFYLILQHGPEKYEIRIRLALRLSRITHKWSTVALMRPRFFGVERYRVNRICR